jgi:glyoxylase-like metal-dependent hydrolase (beta-lactamase superfamily II)
MRSPGAEMIMNGGCDHFIEGARVLFTPEHCVLLWEDKYLFTGDYFAWLLPTIALDHFGTRAGIHGKNRSSQSEN